MAGSSSGTFGSPLFRALKENKTNSIIVELSDTLNLGGSNNNGQGYMKYKTEEERKQAERERSLQRYYANKEEAQRRNHKWHQDNKERVKKRKRLSYLNGAIPYRIKLREILLNGYGRKCVSCGITDERVLDLDHVNGDGAAHRKRVSNSTQKIYSEVIAAGFPDNYRLLCKNCNWLAWLEIKPPTTTL